MREKLSQKVLNLKSSGIRAFFDMANEIPDVISLGVGEPDFDRISTLLLGVTAASNCSGFRRNRFSSVKRIGTGTPSASLIQG